MKITKRQLRRIIKEERVVVEALNELKDRVVDTRRFGR